MNCQANFEVKSERYSADVECGHHVNQVNFHEMTFVVNWYHISKN